MEIKIETPDPVPQADGDCPNPDVCGCVRELPPPVVPPEVWAALKEAEEHAERESGTPTWIGKIDGKRYTGLNRAKHGPCPECYAQLRPAPAGADILGEYIHAAGCMLAQSEAA